MPGMRVEPFAQQRAIGTEELYVMTISSQSQPLTLQEQLVLLCIHPRRGDIAQPHFRYLLSAAALAELMRHNRLALELGRIQVRQTTPLEDRAIDDVFVRFGTTSRPHKIAWWVRNLYGNQAKVIETLAERLVERGILTADAHRALWVIQWTTYPVLEPAYGQKLQKQIRAALLEDEVVAPELATLIAILHHGQALNRVLSASEIVSREHRIATIAASDPVGYAVGKAIADVLVEEELSRERVRRGHYGPPVVVIRPPRHRHPRHPRRWKNTFPGAHPDENGVWSAE